jgi:hypothetical protein
LIVGGVKSEDSLVIVNQLREHLPIVPIQELQQQASQNMDDEPNSLVRLALGAGEKFDQTSFEILVNGLRHSNPDVRFAATRGVGITQWTEFSPELEQLSKTELIEDIQKLLFKALEGCQPINRVESTSDEENNASA